MGITSYTQANKYLGKKDSRPIRYATRINRRGDNIAITHHETDIIIYQPNGRIVIDPQGWHTRTTKDRLNTHLPAGIRIYQKDHIWYISQRDIPDRVFYDGMVIESDGQVHAPNGQACAFGDSAFKDLNKQILKYSRNYIENLFSGKVSKPGSGDCWFCLLKDQNGETMGEVFKDQDHLLSHLEERYYVPSLLARAIELYPISHYATWGLAYLWGELEDGETFLDDLTKRQLGSSLKRYLRRQLGLAS